MLGNLTLCMFLIEFIPHPPDYAMKRVDYKFKHIRYFIQSTKNIQSYKKILKQNIAEHFKSKQKNYFISPST